MKSDKKHEAEEKAQIKKGSKAFLKHEEAEVKAVKKVIKKKGQK